MDVPADPRRITIAILALGGQGGGVLADWIAEVAGHEGVVAQATSVPGVAQRTGSTVYYLELFTRRPGDPEPVLALMPQPGDVDIVIASELMEAGRAILRGFVDSERTTLIGSTHRVYAIGEKSALGDGRASGEKILAAARDRSLRFVGFDMDAAATRARSVISAVMFGALAASGALPFRRETFERVIRESGKAVESNLAGFAAGFDAATGVDETEAADEERLALPRSAQGRELLRRIESALPEPAHLVASEGARRLVDYQDHAYARLYLDRLDAIAAAGAGADGPLMRETARHLALWMSYEDTIRVADLKRRESRFARVREEAGVGPGQLLRITEYMHPRLQEVCETLPAAMGRKILASPRLSRMFARLFEKGRHIRTTSLGWFVLLSLLAGMRRWRRSTLRYRIEHDRIERWLALVRAAAATDTASAMALVECQQLVKGYGETFERGLANFERIVGLWPSLAGRADAAATLTMLRHAALADDEAKALSLAIDELRLAS